MNAVNSLGKGLSLCAPGFASPICNTYGAAGTPGFTAEFLSRPGL